MTARMKDLTLASFALAAVLLFTIAVCRDLQQRVDRAMAVAVTTRRTLAAERP